MISINITGDQVSALNGMLANADLKQMTYIPAPGESYGVIQVPSALGAEVNAAIAAMGAIPTAPLITYAFKKQSTIAAGGVSVNIASSGPPQMVECSTDPASLTLLNTAAAVAAANPSATTPWVPSSGVPVTLTAAQVLTIAAAVDAFIQSIFATLAGVCTAINAGAITATAEIDTPPTGIPAWPVNS